MPTLIKSVQGNLGGSVVGGEVGEPMFIYVLMSLKKIPSTTPNPETLNPKP